MVNHKIITLLLAAVALAASCGQGGKRAAQQAQPRPFQAASVPAVYTSKEEAVEYLTEHYWDAWLAGDGRTDSTLILGTQDKDVEQAFSNYIAILDQAPLPLVRKGMRGLFSKIEARQLADTSSRFYLAFTDIVSRYLYDPNSPMRDEDYYLPFVSAMAESPCTRDNVRIAYRHEAKMCSMNPRGSVAPDFVVTRRNGSRFNLHSVKAKHLLLFFSNPGCNACKEIIDQVMAIPNIEARMASREIAVVNVYIDEDLKAWREYEHNYPRSWYSGYDAAGIIREDLLYNVRAIPSLYLLDAEKRVVFKDAPTERVVAVLTELRQ